MSRKYLRGEIYYADLDPVVGSEQMGTRPVLILQNNVGNHFARTVIVAPITSLWDLLRIAPSLPFVYAIVARV